METGSSRMGGTCPCSLSSPRSAAAPLITAATPANGVSEATSRRFMAKAKFEYVATGTRQTHADGDAFEGRGNAAEAEG